MRLLQIAFLATAPCLSACVGVLVAGAAATAGVIVYSSDDTVEMDVSSSFGMIEEAAKASIADNGGFLKSNSTLHSGGKQSIVIEATIDYTELTVSIEPTTKEGMLKIAVKGRKNLLSDRLTAEKVLVGIRGKLHLTAGDS